MNLALKVKIEWSKYGFKKNTFLTVYLPLNGY